jgi:hypothetical protein
VKREGVARPWVAAVGPVSDEDVGELIASHRQWLASLGAEGGQRERTAAEAAEEARREEAEGMEEAAAGAADLDSIRRTMAAAATAVSVSSTADRGLDNSRAATVAGGEEEEHEEEEAEEEEEDGLVSLLSSAAPRAAAAAAGKTEMADFWRGPTWRGVPFSPQLDLNRFREAVPLQVSPPGTWYLEDAQVEQAAAVVWGPERRRQEAYGADAADEDDEEELDAFERQMAAMCAAQISAARRAAAGVGAAPEE